MRQNWNWECFNPSADSPVLIYYLSASPHLLPLR
jgi:hypothetical protein